MRAFWVFATNNNGRPSLPSGIGGRFTIPLDIYRITGGSGGSSISAHAHLLVGSVGIHADQVNGTSMEGHSHIVGRAGGSWVQITRNGASHIHALNLSGDNLNQDYFLLFWAGPDTDAVAIENHPQAFIGAEASVTDVGNGIYELGTLDSTPWNAQTRTFWENRMLNVLSFELPTEIDRPSRLIRLFLGALVSRPANFDESALRFRYI